MMNIFYVHIWNNSHYFLSEKNKRKLRMVIYRSERSKKGDRILKIKNVYSLFYKFVFVIMDIFYINIKNQIKMKKYKQLKTIKMKQINLTVLNWWHKHTHKRINARDFNI